MNKTNAALWEALYTAYVAAHQDYLEVKLMHPAVPGKRDENVLSDDALGSFAAGKLEKAHRAMHEFLMAHPAMLGGGKPKPARETRRTHPTEETVRSAAPLAAASSQRQLAVA